MLEPQQAGETTPNADLPQEAREYAPENPAYLGGPIDLFADDDEPLVAVQEKKPWWRDRRWIIGISALVIAAIIGLIVYNVVGARAQKVTYQQQALRQGNLVLTVGATGPVQGATYNPTFATSGRVAEIDVQVGQQVTSGQQLAKLDTSALNDALRQAQAQKDQAWWTLQNALWNCANQRSQPPNCTDAANAAYNAVKQQYQTAVNNLNNATLTAPHAGTVTAINGSVGGSSSGSSSSSTGTTTGGGFIQIADMTALQVVASVNEADIGTVATGQPASFTTSAYGPTAFRGTVSLISPAATTTSNVVTYPVTVNVDMSSLQGKNLLPGMTATLTITRARRANVVLLPASAVTFARSSLNLNGSSSTASSANSSAPNITAQQARDAIVAARQMLTALQQQHDISAENPQSAFVLQQNGKQWVVKPVVIGLTDGTFYEALAGLSAGDSVVTGQSGGATNTTTTPRNPLGGGGFGGGGFGGGGNGGGRNGGGTGGGNAGQATPGAGRNGDLPTSANQGL
jgi:multidrug efflux pump subunit AcrA (membrane-fusion protein)